MYSPLTLLCDFVRNLLCVLYISRRVGPFSVAGCGVIDLGHVGGICLVLPTCFASRRHPEGWIISDVSIFSHEQR